MIRFPLFGDSDKAESREPSAVPAADQAAGKPVSATHPLDALTGGVFSAPTSGDRAARVRAWMATDPDPADMQQVYKELSARDKGAAKALREKLDEIKRSKGQEQLGVEWAAKAEALLDARRLNIADAMAWQRDAAKAGAPLSKEPLASLKQRLAERVKGIEDLQTRTQIQREAAVLLAQRVEVLSTKSWQDADAAQAALQADVAHWQTQVQELQQDANWSSVDPRFATQLDSSTQQLQLVVQAFDEALAQTRAAVADAAQPLPAVPVTVVRRSCDRCLFVTRSHFRADGLLGGERARPGGARRQPPRRSAMAGSASSRVTAVGLSEARWLQDWTMRAPSSTIASGSVTALRPVTSARAARFGR